MTVSFNARKSKSSNLNLLHLAELKSNLKGTYTFKQGDEHKIEISGHPRYIDSLNTRVINDQLTLGSRFPFCNETTPFEITITQPRLEKIFIDAESTVTIEDFENQSDLHIKLSQKSFLDIHRFEGLKISMLL